MLRPSSANKTNKAQNVLRFAVLFVAAPALFAIKPALPDAHDLIVRSLEAGDRNEKAAASYVSRTRTVFKQFAPDGTVKSEEIKTYDDQLIGEFHVRTLIAKNDKPLTAAEKAKEDARVAKQVAMRKRETAAERESRLAAAKEKRDKDHRFTRELIDAFDFQVTGEEEIGGRKAWVVEAVPHPGYKPKELKAQMFPHLKGRLWIDKEDLLWVKAEADGIEPFSIGLSVLAKLDQGARLSFEQARMPDGAWVVRTAGIRASGRVAMVKRFSIESITVSDNFRKVPAAARISDGKEDY